MINKIKAVLILVAVMWFASIIASMTWIVLGAGIAYAYWKKDQIVKILDDVNDVLKGKGD